jgi:hypothetical protein
MGKDVCDVAVGDDAAQHTFPGMAVAVDDGIGGIDGAGPENFTFAPTATIFLNQNVALDEIACRCVHADDRSGV